MIHWGVTDSNIPACNRGLILANTFHVTAAEFAQYVDARHMCQRCAKLAKLQTNKTKPQPEPKPRTDSDRYAELRKLVEAVQIDSKVGPAQTALEELLDWRHR